MSRLSTAVREVIYPDPSCLWLAGFFFFLLFLFVRFQHMLSVLYDLGLWNLSTGHYNIPDNPGATGATRLPPCKSSEWNVCFKDMTCSKRPQNQSRHSGFVPRLLLTHLQQNNSLWFFFFFLLPRKAYHADLECAALYKINSCGSHNWFATWCKSEHCISTLCCDLKDSMVLMQKR